MNNEHPIDSLMAASMSNIKEMVDTAFMELNQHPLHQT